MGRYLNAVNIEVALDSSESLPSLDELMKMLNEAQISLLLLKQDDYRHLMNDAWHFFIIANSMHSIKKFGITRVEECHKLASHMFDLLLDVQDLNEIEVLKICFAGQNKLYSMLY